MANPCRDLLDQVEPKDLTQIALQMLGTIERTGLIIPEITDTIRKALEHQQPEDGDIHYAWELHDDEGDWQAGGSAITLESVKREGSHYLQAYSQDGPHTLIIQRVSTIEEALDD